MAVVFSDDYYNFVPCIWYHNTSKEKYIRIHILVLLRILARNTNNLKEKKKNIIYIMAFSPNNIFFEPSLPYYSPKISVLCQSI